MPSGAKREKRPNTVAVVTALAEPLAKEMGLILWDVRFEKEGSSWFLRVFIDRDEGLTMGECEDYTRRINVLLDEADPIEQSYYLEVGSPGVERELTKDWHFERYLGAPVQVRLYRPVDGGPGFYRKAERLRRRHRLPRTRRGHRDDLCKERGRLCAPCGRLRLLRRGGGAGGRMIGEETEKP